MAKLFDLGGDRLDALVQVTPVFVKTEYQVRHARRYLVLPALQYGEERLAQGAQAGSDSDALLDQKGSDRLIVAVRRETNRERTR
jgi:hypothetical protein